MDLFTNPDDTINLLPYDGEVLYLGTVLGQGEADRYFKALMDDVSWKNDEVIIFGKRIVTKRMVAWYGDEGFAYTYSKTTRHALPWTKELLELKRIAEDATGTVFNSCLLNLYHSGEEGMTWHSDNEKELGQNTVIASLSLGAARNFSFKHILTKYKADVLLGHGTLIIMQGATQTHWQHSLPKSKKVKHARINLTFRTFKL